MGHIVTSETRAKIGIANKGRQPRLGMKNSEDMKRKAGLSISFTSKGKKRKPLSQAHKLTLSLARQGEKGSNWQGGKTKQSESIKNSSVYKQWRTSIFKRDNYTCQECKVRGGELQAHHIKPQSRFPELRLEISNGLTLCRSCHMKTETWGYRGCIIEQEVLLHE